MSLDRANISQIIIEGFRFSILTNSGEWFLFGVQDPRSRKRSRKVLLQVTSLFRKFCSQSPAITMFIKQKKQWNLAST